MQEIEINQYKAGQCNIGPIEIKRRYRIGFAGLILMILFILFAELSGIPKLWKLLLFIPAYFTLSGFIQAWNKFCYVYGFKGVFSMEGRKIFPRVKDEQNLEQDRKKVFQILAYVIIGGAALTAVYYFLS